MSDYMIQKADDQIQGAVEEQKTLKELWDEEINRLEQELQKTREQLEKAEKVIEFYGDKDNWYCEEFSYSDWCDCITKTDISPELIGGKLARQYLEDKQGE